MALGPACVSVWHSLILNAMNYLSHEAVIKEASSGAIPVEELSALAVEMRRLWHRIARDQSQPHADRQSYWVLSALERGSRRMSDLAECAQTSQASLTGIVDRLEDRGLVQRARSAEDRRVVEVTLSASGREELFRSRTAFIGRLEDVLSPLDAEERSAFIGLLQKLTEAGPETHDAPCL
jgi:DNA-binding MarR family transcriptional regulator